MGFEEYLEVEREIHFPPMSDEYAAISLLAIDAQGNAYLEESFFQGAISSYHVVSSDGKVETATHSEYANQEFSTGKKPTKEIPKIPANSIFPDVTNEVDSLRQEHKNKIIEFLKDNHGEGEYRLNYYVGLWSVSGPRLPYFLVVFSKYTKEKYVGRWLAIIEYSFKKISPGNIPVSDIIYSKLIPIEGFGKPGNIIRNYFSEFSNRIYVTFSNLETRKLVIFKVI